MGSLLRFEAMLDPPMGAMFLRAVFLAQRSGVSEVGVDNFLAALDAPEIDAILADPVAHAEEFSHHTKMGNGWSFIPMSDDLKQALTAAGWFALGDKITNDMLREALPAAKKNSV
jgi:hypothetical protein